MTVEKLKSVLQFYNHYMDEVQNALPEELPNNPSNYAHLMWMCDKAEFEFLDGWPDEDPPREDVEKAMRWLGFIQGCLLCKGDFTLAQLRDHSRSEDK